MGASFFNSWALWEKMTFALAIAILAVFGIGYGKLLWTNRLVKKQEGKDEAQRIVAEQSRQSEPTIKLQQSQEIPFGVRAIQSGIQIDGIWISNNNMPIPSSPKTTHMRKSSSDLQKAIQSTPSRGRTTHRDTEMGTIAADQLSTSSECQDPCLYRPSSQPRRSSHLRYGSQEKTIDQLECKAVAAADAETNSEKAVGTQEVGNNTSPGDVADNQRSSESESDMALPSSTNPRAGKHQSLPQYSSGRALLEPAKVPYSRLPRSSFPPQSSKVDYCPVPLDSPEYERMELLISPRSSSTEVTPPSIPSYAQTARELTASGESQAPRLTNSRPPPPFISGELHMNKTVRKVNSGFEVLPAGTFGVPVELNGKGGDQQGRWNQHDDADEKRHSNKLQKKIRNSISPKRLSSTYERS